MTVTSDAKYRPVVLAISTLVFCTGIIVIMGWILDIRILTSVGSNYAKMTFNTALGFVMLGASIFLWVFSPTRRFRFFSRLFAFTAFSLGILSFFQEMFHYDLGIDQLFVTDYEGMIANNHAPGRMSSATAVCFALMGLFPFLFDTNKNLYKSIGQGLLHIVTLLSFIGIVGYLYNIPAFYKLSFITSMAVHTSISFFLISLAASLINPSFGIAGLFIGSRIGSIIARKLFFQMVLAILILSYIRMEIYRNALISNEFTILLFGTSFVLVSFFLIWRTSEELNKIDLEKEEVKDNLSKIKTLLDSTPDPIIIVDPKGTIHLANNQIENVFGYHGEELIGEKIEVLLPERFRGAHGTHVSGFFKAPQTREMGSNLELFALKKDETEFPVEISLSPIELDEGLYVSASIRDITERKKSEAKLKKTKDDLEGLTERLTVQNIKLANFAHITSHNLRAPVSNLNSLLHFYKSAEDDEDRELIFGKFETVIDHLSSTLNSLVEALKIREEANKAREVISFEEVLEKIKEIITGQIMESGAIIHSDFMKAPEINYNRGYLESIMLNLLTNAIKYRSPDRSPEVSLKTEKINGDIIFTIRDNGLGIDLSRHGNKLFGLHKTFHRHKEAKGVGLFLTKAQIEAMGGAISAESQMGEGTIFTIKFNVI